MFVPFSCLATIVSLGCLMDQLDDRALKKNELGVIWCLNLIYIYIYIVGASALIILKKRLKSEW